MNVAQMPAANRRRVTRILMCLDRARFVREAGARAAARIVAETIESVIA